MFKGAYLHDVFCFFFKFNIFPNCKGSLGAAFMHDSVRESSKVALLACM